MTKYERIIFSQKCALRERAIERERERHSKNRMLQRVGFGKNFEARTCVRKNTSARSIFPRISLLRARDGNHLRWATSVRRTHELRQLSSLAGPTCTTSSRDRKNKFPLSRSLSIEWALDRYNRLCPTPPPSLSLTEKKVSTRRKRVARRARERSTFSALETKIFRERQENERERESN
jgi:hypothetical protein